MLTKARQTTILKGDEMSRDTNHPKNVESQLLTTRDAASWLGVSESRVRKLCQAGRLGKKLAGRFFISITEMQQFAALKRPAGRPWH